MTSLLPKRLVIHNVSYNSYTTPYSYCLCTRDHYRLLKKANYITLDNKHWLLRHQVKHCFTKDELNLLDYVFEHSWVRRFCWPPFSMSELLGMWTFWRCVFICTFFNWCWCLFLEEKLFSVTNISFKKLKPPSIPICTAYYCILKNCSVHVTLK